MNGYEKLLKTMREEGNKGTTPIYAVRLATMTSDNSCNMSGLELDSDDLYIIDTIKDKLKEGDTVVIARISNTMFVILGKVG